MPSLSQILCTFEFTYSYMLVFVVFIGNNTNVCTVSSTHRHMLQCGCGQPASCTNASKHSLAVETYTFSCKAQEFPWMAVILSNAITPFFNCSTFLLEYSQQSRHCILRRHQVWCQICSLASFVYNILKNQAFTTSMLLFLHIFSSTPNSIRSK